MAKNSKREQIIVYHVNMVSKIPSIKYVTRTQKSLSELAAFAITQFPVAAVVGGLPVPLEKTPSLPHGDEMPRTSLGERVSR